MENKNLRQIENVGLGNIYDRQKYHYKGSKSNIIIKNNKIIMSSLSRRKYQQRVINRSELGKGKRHYWGNEKGDYGFYQSADKNELLRINQFRGQSLHRRHYTSEIQNTESNLKFNYYDRAQNPYLSQRNGNPESRRQANKKILQLNSRNISIQLPAIKIKPRQAPINEMTQTQTPGTHKLYNQKLNMLLQYDISLNNELKTNSKMMHRIRAKTEAAQYHPEQRLSKVKYSPTYVCSFSNPMPTFKLYSANTGSPLYQYGYGELNQ